MASYSRALFALKMCWKVTSVTVSTKTYEWQGILGCKVNVLESRYSEFEFGKKNLNCYDKNQESHCCLNMGRRVTGNSDSNYMPIEECRNGCLTFCSQIWLWNTFPILWDQSSLNQILGKKYVSG